MVAGKSGFLNNFHFPETFRNVKFRRCTFFLWHSLNTWNIELYGCYYPSSYWGFHLHIITKSWNRIQFHSTFLCAKISDVFLHFLLINFHNLIDFFQLCINFWDYFLIIWCRSLWIVYCNWGSLALRINLCNEKLFVETLTSYYLG